MTLTRSIIDFINHYRSLFLNPAGNSTEIVILTAMLIIGIVIAWMGADVLIKGTQGAVRRVRRMPRPWFTFGVFTAGLVLVGIVFIGGLFQLTASPSFCGRVCHSMNPQFQSWRRSEHKNVSCVACHAAGAFPEALTSRLSLLTHGLRPEVAGGYAVPINAGGEYGRADLPSERCQKCHNRVKNSEVDQFNLRVDHSEHVDVGIRCTGCHNRVAHPSAEKYSPVRDEDSEFTYRDNAAMRGCLRCHKKGGKYIDAGGDLIRGPYQKTDGSSVSVDCESCHPENALVQFQADVKTVRARHFKKSPWGQGVVHGETARKVEFQPCQVCHKPATWCTNCHQGITMPHKEGWISPTEHGAKAKQVKFEPCRMCHTVGTVPRCAANGHHHEPFVVEYEFDLAEFDWKSGKKRHGVVAKATAGKPCYRCHDRNTWCSTQCHEGIAMTHDSNWRNVHFTYVEFKKPAGTKWRRDGWQRGDPPCPKCHVPAGRPRTSDYCFGCHHKRFGSLGPLSLMYRMADRYGVNPRLEQKFPLPCQDCHIHRDLQFCRNCHFGSGNTRETDGKPPRR